MGSINKIKDQDHELSKSSHGVIKDWDPQLEKTRILSLQRLGSMSWQRLGSLSLQRLGSLSLQRLGPMSLQRLGPMRARKEKVQPSTD